MVRAERGVGKETDSPHGERLMTTIAVAYAVLIVLWAPFLLYFYEKYDKDGNYPRRRWKVRKWS